MVLAQDSSGRWPGRSQYQLTAHVSFPSGITWGKKDKIPFISVCCLQKHQDLLGSTTHGTVVISGLNKCCCSSQGQLHTIFNSKDCKLWTIDRFIYYLPKALSILIISTNSQPNVVVSTLKDRYVIWMIWLNSNIPWGCIWPKRTKISRTRLCP